MRKFFTSMRSRSAIASVALLLAACASKPPAPPAPKPVIAPAPKFSAADQAALRDLAALQERLYRVAAPLLINNTALCKRNARNLLGFTAKNKYSYSDEFIDAAQTTFQLDERLKVTGVLAGGGAARAGVQSGDVLMAVEGRPLPQGENAERLAAAILAPLVAEGRSMVKITIARDGKEMPLNVPLTPACAFGIEPGNADNVNAYSDGRRVLVTRGMMKFAQNDDELAYVLAHEMAHNILGHAERQNLSATAAGIIDNLIRVHPDMSLMAGSAGLKPTSPELDRVADALSLYLLARAGYAIDSVSKFWIRLARDYPASAVDSYTALHTLNAPRISSMQKTVVVIKRKQSRKQSLVP